MRRRSVLIAACGLVIILVTLSLSRDEEHGRTWLSWLPGQVRHSFAHAPCAIPVHFALGEVDPRFGFDRLTVMTALVEAANLWQGFSEAVLFLESDHPRAMTVSLRFDERQASANTRRSLRGGLDRDQRQLESDQEMLRHWGERIESARRAHERAGEELARRVRARERDVASWNAGEGARTEVRRRALEAEGTALRMELDELERRGQDLNADIAAYNRRAEDMRERAEEFGTRIAQYNQASSADPVETGRYSYNRAAGRRIKVFRAESFDELVWVFAHELGHALGIGHVEEAGAVMHALRHEGAGPRAGTGKPTTLSAADRAALLEVCGPPRR
jgi:ribosome-binding protein aMBF1 (putative translation factor)